MRALFASLLMAGMLTLPLLAGCERTISERKTVTQHRDGTVSRSSETVKERPDGTVVVEKEKNVNR
jgi:hypothetical protein